MVLVVVAGLAAGANPPGPRRADARRPRAASAVSWTAGSRQGQRGVAGTPRGDLVGRPSILCLEYVRQAEGLSRPAGAAWGKNNAALHDHQDATA